MSKWNTTKLMAIASLAAVTIVFALGGAAINILTGIPGMAGFILVFVSAIVLAFCCLLIRRFGAATLMVFIYSICIIPLPLLGTPGFLPKVLIGIAIGLLADFVYLFLKRNEKIAALGIGGITSLVAPFLIVGIGIWFGMPGIEKFIGIASSLPVVIFTTGAGIFSGYLGYRIYKKLENTAVVKRIQA